MFQIQNLNQPSIAVVWRSSWWFITKLSSRRWSSNFRCLCLVEAEEELHRAHEISCGNDDVNLYRQLQKKLYYWPKMAKDASEIQKGCLQYKSISMRKESLCLRSKILEKTYLNFLLHKSVATESIWRLEDQEESLEVLYLAGLFRRGFNQAPLRFLVGN